MNDQNLGKKGLCDRRSGAQDAIEEAGYIMDEEAPDYVVIGLDWQISYEVCYCDLGDSKGAHFIGTNPDLNIPTERGLLPVQDPDCACRGATRVEPVIIGNQRPSSWIRLLNTWSCKREVVMVGDNYLTDIRAGIDNGIPTLLVTTGFTKPEECQPYQLHRHVVFSLASGFDA